MQAAILALNSQPSQTAQRILLNLCFNKKNSIRFSKSSMLPTQTVNHAMARNV